MEKEKPNNINKEAQLIYGIGASSWFHIASEGKDYRIERYSEEGVLECSRVFKLTRSGFNINKPYTFTYISHCKICTIIQKNIKFIFISNES